MNEYLFYGILGLLLVVYARRYFAARSVPTYSAREVKEKLQNSGSSLILLDVRSSKERQHGAIKGSHHIPLHELSRRWDELSKFKGREIICYCQSGNRSLTAALKLKKFGFKIAHMSGGIAEWNYQNLN